MRLKIRHPERKIIVYGTAAAALAALLLSPVYAGIRWSYLGIALLIILAAALTTYALYDRIAVWLLRAKPVSEASAPRLYRVTEKLTTCAGIPMPRVAVLPGKACRAFVHGIARERTMLFISGTLPDTLDDGELEAVIAHELDAIEELGWFPYNVAMITVSLLAGALRRMKSRITWGRAGDAEVRHDGQIRVERAGVSDVPAAVKLLVAHGMYHVVCLNDLTRLAQEASPLFLVARYEGKPAGFLVGEIVREQAGSRGHISKIVVAGDYRRKGIGDSLMQAFADTVLKAGCGSCYIEVRTDNAGAISMYRKHAYVERKIVLGYYPDGTSCQIMVKQL